jgi:hypothetical protein
MATVEYDVFISHAGVDKPGFVELLADRLRRAGVRVWYDDFVIGWGDSISSSIARGLAASRFGIVILSRGFLRGGWPLHELRALLQREVHDGKTILPILHDISPEEVREFNLLLSDMRAMDTSRHDLEQIISTTLGLLRGDGTIRRETPPELLDVHCLADVARLSRDAVLTRLERYANAARLTPGSGEVVLGLGIIHLHLKRFPEAIEKLALAVRLLPASGRAHLYYALALLRSRRPRTLQLTEARQILQALETAASLEPREGLCDLYAAIIKHEYFRANGLRVPPPDLAHHLRELGHKRPDGHELTAFRDLFTLDNHSLLNVLVR